MRQRDVRIECGDGARLAGTLFEPEGPARAAVVVHAATAVPSKIYTPFAGELADRGLAVLVYDYRGTGRSARRPRSLDSAVRMRDWIDLDASAATGLLAELVPGVPLLAVGHSVGGHAIALSDSSARLDAAVFVAMHLAHTGLIPDARERRRVRLLLDVVGPVAMALLGHLPGRRLGLGEDLPSGVVREWAAWTRRPGYFFDDPTMDASRRAAAYTTPTLYVGLDDDPWSTPEAMDRFAAHLPAAPVERLQLAPHPDSPAGHLGFFRSGQRELLWPPVLDWIEGRLALASSRSDAR